MANKQVLVVRAEDADKYTSAAAMKDVAVVAEQESAGEEVITTDPFFADAKYTAVVDMATALKEVKAMTADACVVDYVTSIGMIGEGTDYADLVVVDGAAFADEQYGIAFRKDSDVTAAVNAAITKLVENGTLAEIASEYKLAEQVIAK
jgi:polar amino acid transport system substrate-binding protein